MDDIALRELDWAGALLAVALTALLLWLLRPLAMRFDLLDRPAGRKQHAHPTPVIGGVAMAAGAVVTGLGTLTDIGPAFVAFALSASLLVLVGLLDDKYDLPWWLRILVQVVAALVMIHVGGVRVAHLGPVFGFGDAALGALSVPFTIFATVGIINAVNMVDGADGLAGTLVLAALVMFAGASWYSGNFMIGQRVLILTGVVFAFLWFNLRFPWRPRAKLFMGNAGSAFLGFAIAWLAFRLTQSTTHPVSPVLALWVIPVPIVDCLVLMVRRMRNRQSPFIADRNHVHHLMLEAGFGPMQSCLLLAVFSGLCGLAVGQALRWDVPEPLLLAAFLCLCVLWFWMTSRRERALRFFRWMLAHGFFGKRFPTIIPGPESAD